VVRGLAARSRVVVRDAGAEIILLSHSEPIVKRKWVLCKFYFLLQQVCVSRKFAATSSRDL
jgi:hypothetical protein